MNAIAKFEKVSLKEFSRAMRKVFPKYEFTDEMLQIMLNEIHLPVRSTKRSAGYDFFAPFEFTLAPGTSIIIPTGIRCNIFDDGWFLDIVPKSGIGTKTSIHLSNTMGIIDADYYQSENEGHIMVKLEMPVDNPMPTPFTSHTSQFKTDLRIKRKNYHFEEGQKFVQGIFTIFGITVNDDEDEKEDRNGGFGSTDKESVKSNDPISSNEDDDMTELDDFFMEREREREKWSF